MKPGSSKVVVGVRNLTSKELVLKAGTVIGRIEAANAIPPMLAPKSEKNSEQEQNSNSEQLSCKNSATTNLELIPLSKPTKLMSHIQIKLYSWYMLGMLVKPFIAVLMLYSDEVVKC